MSKRKTSSKNNSLAQDRLRISELMEIAAKHEASREYSEIISCYKQAFKIIKESQSRSKLHYENAVVHSELAEYYDRNKGYVKANKEYNRAISYFSKLKQVDEVRFKIALCYMAKASLHSLPLPKFDIQKSIKYVKVALQELKAIVPEKLSLDVIFCTNKLVEYLIQSGNIDEVLKEAQLLRKNLLDDKKNDHVAECCIVAGQIYLKHKSDAARALEYFEIADACREVDKNPASKLLILSGKTQAYFLQDNYSNAKSFGLEFKELLGSTSYDSGEHEKYAKLFEPILAILGSCYFVEDNHTQIIAYNEWLLGLRLEDADVGYRATSYIQLCHAYFSQRENEQVLKNFRDLYFHIDVCRLKNIELPIKTSELASTFEKATISAYGEKNYEEATCIGMNVLPYLEKLYKYHDAIKDVEGHFLLAFYNILFCASMGDVQYQQAFKIAEKINNFVADSSADKICKAKWQVNSLFYSVIANMALEKNDNTKKIIDAASGISKLLFEDGSASSLLYDAVCSYLSKLIVAIQRDTTKSIGELAPVLKCLGAMQNSDSNDIDCKGITHSLIRLYMAEGPFDLSTDVEQLHPLNPVIRNLDFVEYFEKEMQISGEEYDMESVD